MPVPAQLYVDLFVSVDGFAGGESLPAYFGYAGPGLLGWIAAEKAVDERVLLGRRTYDAFNALPEEVWRADRENLMRRPKVVFSRTLTETGWPNARVSADLVGEVGRLKADGGSRLRTWGSMSLAAQLLAHGLVDRLRIMRFPLVAGKAGRQPAFPVAGSADLELVGQDVLDGRIVLDEYHPTGRDIPRA